MHHSASKIQTEFGVESSQNWFQSSSGWPQIYIWHSGDIDSPMDPERHGYTSYMTFTAAPKRPYHADNTAIVCSWVDPFCTEFHSIGGMWYTLCFIMNRTESVQDNKPVQTTKSYMQTISLFNKFIPKAWSCPLFGLRFITESSAQCIFQWDVVTNSLVLSKLQVNGCNNCIDQIGHFQANYLDHLCEPQPVHFHVFIKQTHWCENLLNVVMSQMTIK